jgi:hypothetical protein
VALGGPRGEHHGHAENPEQEIDADDHGDHGCHGGVGITTREEDDRDDAGQDERVFDPPGYLRRPPRVARGIRVPALVLGVPQVLAFSDPVAVTASVLVAAMAFRPLRRRMSRAARRRFTRLPMVSQREVVVLLLVLVCC